MIGTRVVSLSSRENLASRGVDRYHFLRGWIVLALTRWTAEDQNSDRTSWRLLSNEAVVETCELEKRVVPFKTLEFRVANSTAW